VPKRAWRVVETAAPKYAVKREVTRRCDDDMTRAINAVGSLSIQLGISSPRRPTSPLGSSPDYAKPWHSIAHLTRGSTPLPG
jgi:hypothetical protein